MSIGRWNISRAALLRAYGYDASVPKQRPQRANPSSVNEILQQIQRLRSEGTETVRKMKELERKITTLREQRKASL